MLIGAMAALFLTTGWLLLGKSAAIGAAIGVAAALIIAPMAPKELTLRLHRAEPAPADRHPRMLEIIEELARRAELPAPPKTYYVPGADANAFAVGAPGDAAIAVTEGLISRLDARELTAVLAHEISHIAHRDLWLMGLADALGRLTALAAATGLVLLAASIPLTLFADPAYPWWAPLLLAGAPSLMSLLQAALSRSREFEADRGAARLTGDATGLISALQRLEPTPRRSLARLIPRGRRRAAPALLRTHPPTEERIARLAAFASHAAETVPPERPAPPLTGVRAGPAR